MGGHSIWAVSPDEKRAAKIAELDTPADIGFDRERMLLYVPLFRLNQVQTYKIEMPESE